MARSRPALSVGKVRWQVGTTTRWRHQATQEQVWLAASRHAAAAKAAPQAPSAITTSCEWDNHKAVACLPPILTARSFCGFSVSRLFESRRHSEQKRKLGVALPVKGACNAGTPHGGPVPTET